MMTLGNDRIAIGRAVRVKFDGAAGVAESTPRF